VGVNIFKKVINHFFELIVGTKRLSRHCFAIPCGQPILPATAKPELWNEVCDAKRYSSRSHILWLHLTLTFSAIYAILLLVIT